MEPYIPLSRVPGPIIVAHLGGKPLAPIRYFEEVPDQIFGSSEEEPKATEVTTLRALVGAKSAPTMSEVFRPAA